MEVLLSPKLDQFSTRSFSSTVKPMGRMMAALTLGSQLWHKGMVELSPKHTSFIFSRIDVLHIQQGIEERIPVTPFLNKKTKTRENKIPPKSDKF